MGFLTKQRLHQFVLLALGGLVLGLPFVFHEPAINMPDGYDYLQLARNLAETGEFRTDLITPLSWSLVPELTTHPDLWRAPVYPVLLAVSFTLFGASELVALGVSTLVFLLFLLVSYRVTRKLTDDNTAFIATAVLLSFGLIARTGVTVFSESSYLLFVMLGLVVVVREDDSPYLFGVVSALAYLTRYNHWFLLAGLLYVALRRANQPGRKYLTKFFATFVVVLSPWLLRNLSHVGSPFYHHHMYLLAGHNPINPNFDVFLQFNPENPVWFALTHPGVIVTKWVRNLLKLYRWVPRFFTGTWPVAVFAVWTVASHERRNRGAINTFLTVFGIGFVLQALVLTFVHVKARHFVPYLPVVCLLAGIKLSELRREQPNLAVALTIGVIALNTIAWGMNNPWASDVTPEDYRAVKQHVPAEEPILTNAPELTAWYGERTSLWYAPYDQARRHYPEFNYVFLSPEARRNYSPRVSPGRSYLNNETFREDFEILKRFPASGSRLYVRSSLKGRSLKPKTENENE